MKWPPKLLLTARDMLTFRYLLNYKVMTVEQIWRYPFKKETDIGNVRRRLRKFESSSVSEVNSLKAQIYGFNSQIDALVERLFELPKEVSASPIYKQMENLEQRKSEAVELLDRLSDTPETDFLVNLNDYQSFVSDLRELWLSANSTTKSKIIQSLIHKIEVDVDSVVVHYNVDKRN